MESDYKDTLELQDTQLSKVKLITGSVHKDKNDNETINITFFGRRLTVSKKKRSINEENEEIKEDRKNELFGNWDFEESPTKNHKNRMTEIFDNLMLEQNSKKQEDLRGTLSKHRGNTFVNSPTKLLAQSRNKKKPSTKGKV